MDENLSKYQDAFIEAFEIEDKNQLIDLKYQSMSDKERIAYLIAKEHLGTSFDIQKSIGYQNYKKTKKTK